MKKYILTVLYLGVALGLSSNGVEAADAPKTSSDPVIIKAVGKEVKLSELKKRYDELPEKVRKDASFDNVFPMLRSDQAQRIILDNASKGIESDSEYLKAAEKAKDTFRFQFYLHKEADKLITKEMKDKAYEELAKTMKKEEEIKVRHILVSDEKAAKELIKKINGGANFEQLAKAESQDPGSKDNGGDVGYIRKGQMVPEFTKAAFDTKTGQVHKSPVKTQFGYHVIKVEDRRPVTLPTKEQADEVIMQALRQVTIPKVFDSLMKGAKIEIFKQDGTSEPIDVGASPSSAQPSSGGEKIDSPKVDQPAEKK